MNSNRLKQLVDGGSPIRRLSLISGQAAARISVLVRRCRRQCVIARVKVLARPQVLIVILALTAFLPIRPASASANERFELSQLIEKVKECEHRFVDCSMEVSKFAFGDDASDQPDFSESKKIVQWRDCWYERSYTKQSLPDSSKPSLKITWCNSQKMTVFTSPDVVEEYVGQRSSPTRFNPYSVMLESLGYDQTLSEFLANDQDAVAAFQIEFIQSPDYEGLPTLGIHGRRQLPGSDFVREIELHLLPQRAYLPCFGRYSEYERENQQVKVESGVSAFVEFDRGQPMMQQIQVANFAAASDELRWRKAIIQFNGSPQPDQPDDEFMSPIKIRGNPVVRVFRDGILVSENPYHPIILRKPFRFPPIVIWLFINVLIFGAYSALNSARVYLSKAQPDLLVPAPPNVSKSPQTEPVLTRVEIEG